MAAEKPSLKINGVMCLPPGFRFCPTDEELVVQYLARKAASRPLPASIIPEISIAMFSPWDLPGLEYERYFFMQREGKMRRRATSLGYWKGMGKEKAVVMAASNQVVGMKKVLVFYHGGARTDWVIHEYRLHRPRPAREWVVFKVFRKKRPNVGSISQFVQSSPESSCITNLSDEPGEEISSRSVESSPQGPQP